MEIQSSDFDKEEIKRHFSISASLIPVPWDKVKINVLDTPGYFDFVGEVEEAVSAADAAIIVVSGKAGFRWEHRKHGISARNTDFRVCSL